MITRYRHLKLYPVTATIPQKHKQEPRKRTVTSHLPKSGCWYKKSEPHRRVARLRFLLWFALFNLLAELNAGFTCHSVCSPYLWHTHCGKFYAKHDDDNMRREEETTFYAAWVDISLFTTWRWRRPLRGWWCRKTGREVSYSPGFCKHKTHHVLGNRPRNDVKSFPLFFQRTRKKRQPNFIFHLLSLVLLFCLLLCCVVVVLGKFVSPLCMISKDLRYI